MVASALSSAPDHHEVLALMAGLDLGAAHRAVLDALVAVGDRARPVSWCGPGTFDMIGGPCGAEVVAEVVGWEVARPYVLAPLTFDAAGAVVPVEVLAGWFRGRRDEARLRAALVAAESAVGTDRDPARIAADLIARLAEVAA